MSILQLIIIGTALAMDALGVTLSVGVNESVNKNQKIGYIVSFGFFQFLLTLVGGIIGCYFNKNIIPISDTMGGIVIGIIGILMIVDGLKEKEESILTKNSMIVILGISVSIDAIVVGFTLFNKLTSLLTLLVNCLLIGLITLLICTIGFYLCKFIKKINFISKYADFFGGMALIIFSFKMIFF